MPRLFVALDPGEPPRAALDAAASRGRLLAPSAKWVKPESLHLTLAFLGDVAAERLPELAPALDAAARPFLPFELALDGAGTFGSPRRPRVLFAGVSGDADALVALQAAVASALASFAPPEARRYHPHLTLARARDLRGDPALARAAEELGPLPPERFRVEAITLYESHLAPSGARHVPLHHARLCGA